MALREIRINFYSGDGEIQKSLTQEIGIPFTFYMDALMRGRFKEYSGPEVKGVNIVNLNLHTPDNYKEMKERSKVPLKNKWIKLLNTYEFDTEFNHGQFQGMQKDKIKSAFDLFISCAELSDLPQMSKLVGHLRESFGNQSIDDAVAKTDEYLRKLGLI
ncbi:hypothetical protein ACVBEJ_13390 [Porticoccus sp. GXU_MW_L64]